MPAPKPAAAPRIPRGLPEATAFFSSFCVMVIELVAGRIISRHLGNSLYTWTSVIGIVLAGLAIGNALGGRLADRRPPIPTLSLLFLAASVSCTTVLFMNAFVGEWMLLWGLSWPMRIATHISLVFLVPGIILGMIGPFAAKMAVESSQHTGRALGNVSAWSVVGSILGTFATGFVLIAAFGTTAIVWGVAAALALCSLLFAGKARGAWIWVGLFAALAVIGAGPSEAVRRFGERIGLRERTSPDDVYVDESQYSYIVISRASDSPKRRYLRLDKLLHSSIVIGEPQRLQYGYERIYAGVTQVLGAGRDSVRTLNVGGGGYTFPRYLQTQFPRGTHEVVEIDPAVTRAAIAAFDLDADHPFPIAHEDGRAFLQRLSERVAAGEPVNPYDFVFMDCFNDYSVPYQLTTIECLRAVEAVLSPDGAYMMNLIDVYSKGRFLGGMIATMEAVFDEVRVFSEGVPSRDQPNVRNTYILVGTKRPWNPAPVIAAYDPQLGLSQLGAEDRADLLRRTGGRLITDDWAPIDNFLAPVVNMASREVAAATIVERAEDLLESGDTKAALDACEAALDLHELDPNVRRVYANALIKTGDLAGAAHQFEALLRVRPDLLGARIQLASVLARLGRIDEGIAQIEDTIARNPQEAQAHFVRGILLEQANRGEGAIEAYLEASRLDPSNLEIRNNLGIAFARAGRNAEAEQAFEEILAADPNFEKARQNLQRLLASQQS